MRSANYKSTNLRPLVRQLRTLYSAIPSGPLRNAARNSRRASGAEYRQATGQYEQTYLLPDLPTNYSVKKPGRIDSDDVAIRIRDGREITAVNRILGALQIAGIKRLTWTDSDIREAAFHFAEKAKGYIGWLDARVVRMARAWLGGVSFEIPGKSPKQQRRRLMNPRFWRKIIRKFVWQAIEKAYLVAKLVGGKRDTKYVSNQTVKIRNSMNESQQSWMEATTIEYTDATGNVVSLNLAELHKKSKIQKQAEFWAWLHGTQILAEQQGLIAAMITLTLEPEWHPNPTIGKGNWNGKTPAEANQELVDRWARLRASLTQLGIVLSGFRMVHAHEDGCPHWHVLIYFPQQNLGKISAEILKLWPGKLKARTRTINQDGQQIDIKEYFDEPTDAISGSGRVANHENEGAQTEISIINTGIASVATYIARGILNPIEDKRMAAWYSCWKIRKIQWFGVREAFTSWRELRKIAEKDAPNVGPERALWILAHNGDVAGFLEMLGGLAAAPVSAAASMESATRMTLNRYDEPVRRIKGIWVIDLRANNTSTLLISRPRQWTVKTAWSCKQKKQ